MRARQRDLGIPEAFEWVHEVTPRPPPLRVTPLPVMEAPLMVFTGAMPADAPEGVTVRMRIEADDPGVAGGVAAQDTGTGAATAPGLTIASSSCARGWRAA